MASTVKRFAAEVAAPPREVAPRTFRFIASTDALDRDGDVIEPSGWDLGEYQRNPVILLLHETRELPVARAIRCEVTARGLEVDVLFPDAGISARSDEAYGLVKAGILRALSVGFQPLEAKPLPGGGQRFTRARLLEISLVSVPSNPEALLAARLGGKAKPEPVFHLPMISREEAARLDAAVKASRERIERLTAPKRETIYAVNPDDVRAAVEAAVVKVVRTEVNRLRGRLDDDEAPHVHRPRSFC